MKKDYRKIAAMSTAALGLAGLLGMASIQAPKDASAYFTTYVSAGGSQVVNMGAQTEIHEEIINMVKQVTVTNVSDNDCFVRVKVFYSGSVPVKCEDVSGASLWTQTEKKLGSETWEYGKVVKKYEKDVDPESERAKESTAAGLNVEIGPVPADFDRDSFNVVVVQECTPITYDEEGKPVADWNLVFEGYQGEGVGE